MEARQTRRRKQVPRGVRRKRFEQALVAGNHEGPTAQEYLKRREELLDECKIPAKTFEAVATRLHSFLTPFLETLVRREQGEHADRYVRGLLSELDQKNAESIAYLYGVGRLGLQRFIGWADWNDAPWREELARQIGRELGAADGVLVFDPSGFPKSGRESVGVARQWCGRLGKVDNCQVAVYLGYVSQEEHALVDVRLYLPKEWTSDKARLLKARVPRNRWSHRTRHQLCLEMLQEKGRFLPHAWVTGDDELGRVFWFRARLKQALEQYLLAVPSNTLIRDLEVPPPEYRGRGPRPKRPWQRVDRWLADRAEEGWTEIDVRDGAKGPLVVEVVKCRVVARGTRRQEGHDEVLVVIRYRDRDDDEIVKVDYYLSNAPAETSLTEFARVAKAEHRIEECLQRGKSEAGLGDYQCRNWVGWQRHQTLSLLALWFLLTETRRGKKMDTGDHSATDPRGHFSDVTQRFSVSHRVAHPARPREVAETQRTGEILPL
jgi:SRSO17 transposase